MNATTITPASTYLVVEIAGVDLGVYGIVLAVLCGILALLVVYLIITEFLECVPTGSNEAPQSQVVDNRRPPVIPPRPSVEMAIV
jgi:hypothetical protein